ncbi:hypothetical protein [Chloroflexus sp.]|nr:hypothetical protein [uncultured Chloroflexus sp.]
MTAGNKFTIFPPTGESDASNHHSSLYRVVVTGDVNNLTDRHNFMIG